MLRAWSRTSSRAKSPATAPFEHKAAQQAKHRYYFTNGKLQLWLPGHLYNCGLHTSGRSVGSAEARRCLAIVAISYDDRTISNLRPGLRSSKQRSARPFSTSGCVQQKITCPRNDSKTKTRPGNDSKTTSTATHINTLTVRYMDFFLCMCARSVECLRPYRVSRAAISLLQHLNTEET